jgi:hypothetical protein
MFEGYLDAATSDLDTLERWSREHPRCNWGVVPVGSGVWALDVDAPSQEHEADGVAALRGLCDRHGPLPPRPQAASLRSLRVGRFVQQGLAHCFPTSLAPELLLGFAKPIARPVAPGRGSPASSLDQYATAAGSRMRPGQP